MSGDRELRQRLRDTFTRDSLAVVASAALDRGRAERIIEQLASGSDTVRDELRQMARPSLIEQVVEAFYARQDGADLLVSELDRATRTEQNLVSAISIEEVAQRLGSHEVLRLRRLGAKLAWALVRDGRAELRPLGEQVLGEYLDHATRIDEARRAAKAKGAADELRQVEESYREAAERSLDLEAEISAVEQERAALVAEVGRREMESRQQQDRQRSLGDQLEQLKKELASTRAPDGQGQQATGKVKRQLRKAEKRLAEAEKEKEALTAARSRVAELEEENARLRSTLDKLRELRASERAVRPPAGPVALGSEATKTTPVVEAPRRGRAKGNRADVRVGIFLDVANLSGAARRLYKGAVDYRRLLGLLLGGRRLVEARAYAIDKGRGFDGFARALRAAGYRVSAKKPKIFPDGEMKADWDIGITVDVLARSDKIDVVVLGSGDGDFTPVVNALKKKGLQVEAAGFPERTAEALVRSVDRFVELDATTLES